MSHPSAATAAATAPRPEDDQANRFHRWRLNHGLTQDEVADLTGLDKSMVSRVERGQRNLAPLTKVRVARRLGVAVSALFEVPNPEVGTP